MNKPKLSVVIPVYNEENTIETIFNKVRDVDISKEIIFVDDGSSDGSVAILERIAGNNPKVHLIVKEKNEGKGAALRSGFEKASGEYVIVQDADLEYDPQDYHKLLKEIEKDGVDVVYGSRFLNKDKSEIYRGGNMQATHLLGNKLLTIITNLLYGVTLTDMETCYKLIPTPLISSIKIRSDRFNFEPEITAKIIKRGKTIKEVPIYYLGREVHEGKKINWRDGFAAMIALLKYRFVN